MDPVSGSNGLPELALSVIFSWIPRTLPPVSGERHRLVLMI
jgi:hypothetical protein